MCQCAEKFVREIKRVFQYYSLIYRSNAAAAPPVNKRKQRGKTVPFGTSEPPAAVCSSQGADGMTPIAHQAAKRTGMSATLIYLVVTDIK